MNQLLSFAKNNAALLLIALGLFSIGIRLDPLAQSARMENRCINTHYDSVTRGYELSEIRQAKIWADSRESCLR